MVLPASRDTFLVSLLVVPVEFPEAKSSFAFIKDSSRESSPSSIKLGIGSLVMTTFPSVSFHRTKEMLSVFFSKGDLLLHPKF